MILEKSFYGVVCDQTVEHAWIDCLI